MGFFDRLDKRLNLMSEMMHTVDAAGGIPADYSAEQQLRSAAMRCIGCSEPDSCRKWLTEHRDGARSAPDFCPNRELFASWSARVAAGL